MPFTRKTEKRGENLRGEVYKYIVKMIDFAWEKFPNNKVKRRRDRQTEWKRRRETERGRERERNR